MLHMCVCMHSRFVENQPIQILEDGPLISEVVLSQVTQESHVCYDKFSSRTGDQNLQVWRRSCSQTKNVMLSTREQTGSYLIFHFLPFFHHLHI
jgi:hypothetical protein